eukprot:Nk52_evm1s2315 gene=Nk52_evmTU1s2315
MSSGIGLVSYKCWGGFIALLMSITVTYAVVCRNSGLSVLLFTMLFPSICVTLITLCHGEFWTFILRSFFSYKNPFSNGGLGSIVGATLIGLAINALYLGAILMLVLVNGWGTLQPLSSMTVPTIPVLVLLRKLLFTIGEELGWRAFLLPALLSRGFSFIQAILIVGSIWGLFHSPGMIILSGGQLGFVALQAISCLAMCAGVNHVAILGGFTIWPSLFMHMTWNIFNPYMFGDIYAHHPGVVVHGPMWLINGESLSGILVGAVMTAGVTIFAHHCPSVQGPLRGYSRV